MKNIWTDKICRKHVAVWALTLLWLLIPVFGQAQTLAKFLDEKGQLVIPADYSGSLDPAGFEMQTAADGTPRFMPQVSNNVAPGEWEDFGGPNFGCNGTIRAMVSDASGSIVYLGGDFTVCGEVAANYVVAYDPATNQFHSLGSGVHNGVDNTVLALAVSGSDVYVGGSLTEAGGNEANLLARWDGGQWHSLGEKSENGVSGVNSVIRALAVNDSDVYVGGALQRGRERGSEQRGTLGW